MTLMQYQKLHNLSDDELLEHVKTSLGLPTEEAALYIAMEKGESEGDVIEK